MHSVMEKGAGIYRIEVALSIAQNEIQELKDRFRKAQISDLSRTFNTELIGSLELSCLLDLAESIIQSALNRKESRGSHQRSDFKKRDDEHYLSHSLA